MRKTKRKTMTPVTAKPEPEAELKPIQQKVFLYFQLKIVERLPDTDKDYEIHLMHKTNRITKLQDKYTEINSIELNKMKDGNYPGFVVTVIQDDIDEINTLSDNPLVLVLYEVYEGVLGEEQELGEEEGIERVNVSSRDGDEEGEEEQIYKFLRPIAQGYIDLMEFFTDRRVMTTVRCYLYPRSKTDNHDMDPLITAQTVFEVYSLLPLLKDLTYVNLLFITFESIYNASQELIDASHDLIADLYLQSKNINENEEPNLIKICSFSHFDKSVIAEQNLCYVWENIVDDNLRNSKCIGIYTGCRLTKHRIFRKLFGTEGIQFNYDAIDIDNDVAIVGNATHRFALSESVSRICMDEIAFNTLQLLIRIYNRNEPDVILLEGVQELSILVYPWVNACRFAIHLYAPNLGTTTKTETAEKRRPSKKSRGRGSKADKKSNSSFALKPKPTFVIISICLTTPLSIISSEKTPHTGNPINRDKIRSCVRIHPEAVKIKDKHFYYQNFDMKIDELIGVIVQQNIARIDKIPKNFFCCDLKNITDTVIQIIASDFNKRFPTDCNSEFAHLMTTVYKELEQRIYTLIQAKTQNPRLFDPERKTKMIAFLNMAKLLRESGNNQWADLIMKKINLEYANDIDLEMYLFLENMEMGNYDAAKKYLAKTVAERGDSIEFVIEYFKMYIKYMETLTNEVTFNQAMENLLDDILLYLQSNRKDTYMWILLNSIYKKCGYLPGTAFTRWRYENYNFAISPQLPELPKSRWMIYNSYNVTVRNEKIRYFINAINFFVNFGLYKFAQFIFDDIANDLIEFESYFLATTFNILMNQVPPKYATKNFAVEKYANSSNIKAQLASTNGHLDYHRESIDTAMKSYSRIVSIDGLDNICDYQLGLLRYAYTMMDKQNYQSAFEAFQKCYSDGGVCFAQYFGMGRAMFKLGHLEQAEVYLAKSTFYKIHIPDIWAYLALVNLKLGKNCKALESWKYAKLKPENVICDEIYDELSKIDHKDVLLFVDPLDK